MPQPTHSPPPPPIPPISGLALGILAVSSSSIITRYAQALAPSPVIAAYRLALASLLLLPLLLTRHRSQLLAMGRRRQALAALAGVMLAVHFASWIKSLELTSVASSVVLVSTSPLFVSLLAPFFLGERPSRPLIIGMLLALMGSTLIGLGDACRWQDALQCPSFSSFITGPALRGDLLALLGAVSAAGYMLIGRSQRGDVPLIPYISLAYGSAAIVLILALIVSRQPAFGYPPMAYLWFLALAIVPQLFAHSTYNWALRYLPAAFVSITLLGEPVGATILAYFLLGEAPGVLTLIGGALILAGIVLASLRPSAGLPRRPEPVAG